MSSVIFYHFSISARVILSFSSYELLLSERPCCFRLVFESSEYCGESILPISLLVFQFVLPLIYDYLNHCHLFSSIALINLLLLLNPVSWPLFQLTRQQSFVTNLRRICIYRCSLKNNVIEQRTEVYLRQKPSQKCKN